MNNKIYKLYKSHKRLEKLYKETFIGGIIRFFLFIKDFVYHKTNAFLQFASSVPRAMGYFDSTYSSLKSLEGRYSGKRCFIVCTGPSLTITDLELLKNEYVFGMNSTAMILDRTIWRPDFYGIQDPAVYERLKGLVNNPENGLIFAPIAFKRKYNTPDNWIYFPICYSYNLFECYKLKKYFAKFSPNSYVKVYNGFTISYSLIQIAYYLGFREMYLLGADCGYSAAGKNHFAEHGHVPSNLDISTHRLITIYGYLRKFSDKADFKVYNATRGGMLEEFERVKLEDVLAKQEKNKTN